MIGAMFAGQATDGLVAERKTRRCELERRRRGRLRVEQCQSGGLEAGRHDKPDKNPNEPLAHHRHPRAKARRRCGRSRQFAYRSRSPFCPRAASLALRANWQSLRLRAPETFADRDCRAARLTFFTAGCSSKCIVCAARQTFPTQRPSCDIGRCAPNPAPAAGSRRGTSGPAGLSSPAPFLAGVSAPERRRAAALAP